MWCTKATTKRTATAARTHRHTVGHIYTCAASKQGILIKRSDETIYKATATPKIVRSHKAPNPLLVKLKLKLK